MDKVTFTINGRNITVDKGVTILEAALANDIYIPHLCYHPDLKPAGVCRLCMVEIEGRKMSVACHTQAEQGMIVKTESPNIDKVRRTTLELLIINNHPDYIGSGESPCELERIVEHIGISKEHLNRLRPPTKTLPLDTSNPFFDRDLNKCVLCGICVRACSEIEGVGCIDFAQRGYDTIISTFGNRPLKESTCVSCGECVIRCPVEALTLKQTQKPSREVKTTCPYCGVGCGLYLGIHKNRVVSARGDRDNPINKGNLCVKGRFGYEFVNHPERLTSPLIKHKGKLVRATWDDALELIKEKFSQYQKEQFATLSSAKCTNEDNYIIQKFTRKVMGTNNIDHCARLCHAPTVAGLAQSFGSGAMTNSINEILDACTIFAIGTNTTSAHPIIALKVKRAVEKGATLVVANPKEIDLCASAHLFLQHLPGSDVALLMGIMRAIVDAHLEDECFINERTENFSAFRESLNNFIPEFVQKTTNVPWQKIQQAARLYATNKPSSILYAMGITQHTHGTDNVLATSNLALLTGNVGKPSTGVNPLRGQNNVQGACDLAALPNVYPGYQKVDLPEIKKKFESAWNTTLSDKPGLTHLEIFDAIYEGKIKALYTVGENPILSEANSSHVEEALKRIEFFVAQDIFLSETAEFAHVVLPAASFAEKDGTFTNTERRVQRIRRAIESPGEAKPDWLITCLIAKKMNARGFDFSHPEEIMQEIALLTPSYQGISYERIEDTGLQWPCPAKEHPGTVFLHKERFATQTGKGKFIPLEYKPPAEETSKEYPFIFTTDRSLYHFHTSTMTRKVEGLEILNPEELLIINPEDAAKLAINDGDMVLVSSCRGRVKVKAKVSRTFPPGVTSMTFHFHEARTNLLTNSSFDPIAKIPETKVCAVNIEKLAKT